MIVIPNTLKFLANEVMSSHSDTQILGKDIDLTLFICLLGFLVIGYATLWLPFIFTLTNKIWNAQRMLAIIPIEAGEQISALQVYLAELYQKIKSQKGTGNNPA